MWSLSAGVPGDVAAVEVSGDGRRRPSGGSHPPPSGRPRAVAVGRHGAVRGRRGELGWSPSAVHGNSRPCGRGCHELSEPTTHEAVGGRRDENERPPSAAHDGAWTGSWWPAVGQGCVGLDRNCPCRQLLLLQVGLARRGFVVRSASTGAPSSATATRLRYPPSVTRHRRPPSVTRHSPLSPPPPSVGGARRRPPTVPSAHPLQAPWSGRARHFTSEPGCSRKSDQCGQPGSDIRSEME